MKIEWLEPWFPTDEWTDSQRNAFVRQLQLEVDEGHPLFRVPVQVIARHGGSDDTLFELLDNTGRFAMVHLTWSKSKEAMPWPITTVYASLQDFALTQMCEDNEEYNL